MSDTNESLLRARAELEKEVQERRKAQSELALVQRDLQSFFDSAPLFMGIVEHAPEGMRYLMVNDAVSTFLGQSASEVNGKLVTDTGMNLVTFQEWVIRCRQSKTHGTPVRWEFVSSRNGASRAFACHVNYIGLSPDGNDRYSYASEEITEKIEMERKKEEQSAKLSHLSKMSALGEMASGIAHEIYNPLSIIKGFADLIHKKASKGAIDVKELLQISSEMQGTSRRITEIVEGLRFFAREGSHDPMELTSVDNILSTTLRICSERFRKYGVKLEVRNFDKNQTVACREVQISQVVLNLLNNAFDSVKNEDEKRVTIETELHDGNVYIRISDSGPGVPEMLWSKIFEPFFATNPIGLGTGMGLSIC